MRRERFVRDRAPHGPSQAPVSGYDRPMFRRLRTPLLLVAVLAVALPGTAAETHPFSIHDMLAMDRISDAQVSPDGTQVAFVLRTTDLAANRGRTDLWLLDVRTKAVRRLTTHEAGDTNPRWSADGKSLFFLSTRGGSQQVWNLPLAGGEAEKVTSEPLDVDNLEVAPGGKLLVLSMEVFPGKSPAETKKAARGEGSGEVERDALRPPLRPPLGHLEGRPQEPRLRPSARRGREGRPLPRRT